MNEDTVIKLALTAGLLNYMDNETPRHYFIDGNAGLEEVIEFAELIIRECAAVALREDHEPSECILNHFGLLEVEE